MRPLSRPAVAVIAATLLSITHLSGRLEAQVVSKQERFSMGAAFIPRSDEAGPGGAVQIGACVTRCDDRLSFWALGSLAARTAGIGVAQVLPQESTVISTSRNERTVGLSALAQYRLSRPASRWAVSLQGGIILSQSRLDRNAAIASPTGVALTPTVRSDRFDYGPSVGVQVGRRVAGVGLTFTMRAEDTDRWRVPVGLGLAF